MCYGLTKPWLSYLGPNENGALHIQKEKNTIIYVCISLLESLRTSNVGKPKYVIIWLPSVDNNSIKN